MTHKADRDALISTLRACIQSKRGGIELSDLENDYLSMVGHEIPFRAWGYSCVEEFIENSSEIFMYYGSRGQILVKVRPNESSMHIAKLIEKEKKKKEKAIEEKEAAVRAKLESQRRAPLVKMNNDPDWFPKPPRPVTKEELEHLLNLHSRFKSQQPENLSETATSNASKHDLEKESQKKPKIDSWRELKPSVKASSTSTATSSIITPFPPKVAIAAGQKQVPVPSDGSYQRSRYSWRRNELPPRFEKTKENRPRYEGRYKWDKEELQLKLQNTLLADNPQIKPKIDSWHELEPSVNPSSTSTTTSSIISPFAPKVAIAAGQNQEFEKLELQSDNPHTGTIPKIDSWRTLNANPRSSTARSRLSLSEPGLIKSLKELDLLASKQNTETEPIDSWHKLEPSVKPSSTSTTTSSIISPFAPKVAIAAGQNQMLDEARRRVCSIEQEDNLNTKANSIISPYTPKKAVELGRLLNLGVQLRRPYSIPQDKTYVQHLEEFCSYKEWPMPIYVPLRRYGGPQFPVLYGCEVTVASGHIFNSYPDECPEYALSVMESAAKKAYLYMIDHERMLICHKEPVTVDWALIQERVSMILRDFPNGIFTEALFKSYSNRHNENLPCEWLTILMRCNTVDLTQTAEGYYIVYPKQ